MVSQQPKQIRLHQHFCATSQVGGGASVCFQIWFPHPAFHNKILFRKTLIMTFQVKSISNASPAFAWQSHWHQTPQHRPLPAAAAHYTLRLLLTLKTFPTALLDTFPLCTVPRVKTQVLRDRHIVTAPAVSYNH